MAAIHQIAEAGPVHFSKTNIDVWLHQHVDIFMEMSRAATISDSTALITS
jgi:hypothetical protein